jgi:hypothetical protein
MLVQQREGGGALADADELLGTFLQQSAMYPHRTSSAAVAEIRRIRKSQRGRTRVFSGFEPGGGAMIAGGERGGLSAQRAAGVCGGEEMRGRTGWAQMTMSWV